MKKTYPTQAAFAKVLNVTKGTMSKYVHRDDWPVKTSPPWNDEDLRAVQQWRQTLREDMNWTRELESGGSEELVNAPGWEVTISDVLAHPAFACVRDWMGPAWKRLTVDDLEDLAGAMKEVFITIQTEGAGGELKPKAPRAYYTRMMRVVNGERMVELLNTATLAWMNRRRDIDAGTR